MRERKRLRSVLHTLSLKVDTNSLSAMVSIRRNRDNRHHLFCPDQCFVASFLAVNDVIARLGGHEDFDAPVGSFGRFGGGPPEQLAVGFDTKDVQVREHGFQGTGFIPQTLKDRCTKLNSKVVQGRPCTKQVSIKRRRRLLGRGPRIESKVFSAVRALRRLGRGGDPPQDSGYDLPSGAFAENDGLIVAVFGLENVKLRIAAQARDAQALFFVGHDYDFSVKIRAIGLRGIDGGDIAIVDQRLHGTPTHAEKARISGIGAPLERGAHHLACGNIV